MKKLTAVIPVRKGSVRVKNKNLKPFAGTTLLEIKIKQLKQISLIDDIFVSSDCKKMLKIATNLGVKTHLRDEYFASSEATNSEFFNNLADSIPAEYIMYSPVTCPLISLETYRDCVRSFKKDEKIDNLVTVKQIKHHMWMDGKPLNYKISESPNSQDLPDINAITYGISIISKENMLKFNNIVSENPTFRILDEIESIDIDTEFDFMIAEMIYRKLYGDLK
jgi:CMP-N-acetylneuraminic acid synthetase